MNERLNINNWLGGGVSNPTLDDYVAKINGVNQNGVLDREFISNPKNRSQSIPKSEFEVGELYEVQAKIDGRKHRAYYFVSKCDKTEIMEDCYEVESVVRQLGGQDHVRDLIENPAEMKRMITEDSLCR
jgi:hypothetical protein